MKTCIHHEPTNTKIDVGHRQLANGTVTENIHVQHPAMILAATAFAPTECDRRTFYSTTMHIHGPDDPSALNVKIRERDWSSTGELYVEINLSDDTSLFIDLPVAEAIAAAVAAEAVTS